MRRIALTIVAAFALSMLPACAGEEREDAEAEEQGGAGEEGEGEDD